MTNFPVFAVVSNKNGLIRLFNNKNEAAAFINNIKFLGGLLIKGENLKINNWGETNIEELSMAFNNDYKFENNKLTKKYKAKNNNGEYYYYYA